MKKFLSNLCLLVIISGLPLGLMGATNEIVLEVDSAKTTISPHIYGHFAEHLGRCVYGGFYVGEDSDISNANGIRKDIVEALKEISIPNLRWPGGCFADAYHWKDGIGPKEQRPPMINTHWGMITEDNSFGTHEFLELCKMLDAEPVIAGNVGSGTVEELSDWVEYVNSDITSDMTKLRQKHGKEKAWYAKYWGVGNESWGCGGNMNPTQYYEKMCRYSTYMTDYPGKELYKVAVGPSGFNLDWTEEFMQNVGKYGGTNLFDGYSLHYYTVPGNWDDKGSATKFGEQEYFTTMKKSLRLEELIEKNWEIMNKYLPENSDVDIIVDEWGCWHNPEPGSEPGFLYQQNTLRDALVAATSLNIFNKWADVVTMANLAQTINVLQAVILTQNGEMVKTPTYYVFKMYKAHQGAALIPSKDDVENYEYNGEEIPAINSSASIDEEGYINITAANFKPNQKSQISYSLKGIKSAKFVSGEVITAAKINAHNKFGEKEVVNINEFSDVKVKSNKVIITLPEKSIVKVTLK